MTGIPALSFDFELMQCGLSFPYLCVKLQVSDQSFRTFWNDPYYVEAQ